MICLILNCLSCCSKSLVHPGKNLNCNQETESWNRPLARRVLESLNDQENVQSSSFTATKSLDKGVAKETVPKKSLKRPLSEVDTNINASQPPAAKKKPPKRAPNKKSLPLQKGQKQLTAFFRV